MVMLGYYLDKLPVWIESIRNLEVPVRHDVIELDVSID